MKLLVYRPQGNGHTDTATGVLWIHGGGYLTGMASMAGVMGRAPSLVKKYGAVVVSPAYRLGKKGRYPNALNDCYDALRYMLLHAKELGINPNQIFVGGESAGGGLTAALCMLARDRQEVNIAFQMPLYPMIDDRDTESSKDNHNIVWNTKLNHLGWKIYLGHLYGSDQVPAYAAAARQKDFSNLPPAYTFVCTAEPFYCETLAFISALKAAGVEAHVDVYNGLFHAFDMTLPWMKISRTAARNFEAAFVSAQAKYFKANHIA
ncbi:MAG: alpha/beta hydrolase [Oscillospiraceae bacterium]